LKHTLTVSLRKEQVRMEHKSRRNYPKVWAQVAEKDTNKFYHQNEIDAQLRQQLKLKDLCPIRHNNQGESLFFSPEMYKNLLGICRCGRSREGLHMGKCLQRTVSPNYERTKTQECPKPEDNQEEPPKPRIVPRTSNSNIGFLRTAIDYHKLERSMQYVSPSYSMNGPRITAVPYHTIIIG
ncbi:hypothetical protein KR074_006786, partial [Drosophila pseudoananassae]